MTNALTQTVAFVLAALVTAGTVAGANAAAHQQFAANDRIAVAGMQRLALQTVTVVGHRAKA